jgi:hypothetical protein
LGGCSEKPESKLYGDWANDKDNPKITLHFNEDKTMNANILGKPSTYTYSVKDDELSWTETFNRPPTGANPPPFVLKGKLTWLTENNFTMTMNKVGTTFVRVNQSDAVLRRDKK